MIRTLLADDHALVRRNLRQIIEIDGVCSVCGEAGDGEEAVLLATSRHPDVVVLDLTMPRLSGIEAARQIRSRLPNIGIAIVTMHDAAEARRMAFAAGAGAYVLKNEAMQHLVPAIWSLAAGKAYRTPFPDRPPILQRLGRRR